MGFKQRRFGGLKSSGSLISSTVFPAQRLASSATSFGCAPGRIFTLRNVKVQKEMVEKHGKAIQQDPVVIWPEIKNQGGATALQPFQAMWVSILSDSVILAILSYRMLNVSC